MRIRNFRKCTTRWFYYLTELPEWQKEESIKIKKLLEGNEIITNELKKQWENEFKNSNEFIELKEKINILEKEKINFENELQKSEKEKEIISIKSIEDFKKLMIF
ncbi:Uncharacterised protein (plasmid) [Mesomycoplasma neurolyticum]|uniref:Uncharacterized protein n=1 Tax=Mesomycoplasma neurolyticum TaxID=2120 RepID=A0A449A6J3_9BACT|nr:Uncharacterised protein [Mesomycoplasma neurolyticum]